MKDRYRQSEDVLFYLQTYHTGADNPVRSAELSRTFHIDGRTVREIVNRLRCEGKPVCSDANGYYYAKNHYEINRTVEQLLSRSSRIQGAARGLVLSHQVFLNGLEGGL